MIELRDTEKQQSQESITKNDAIVDVDVEIETTNTSDSHYHNHLDIKNADGAEGLDYLQEATDLSQEEIDALDKKVRRKIDCWIMPIICFTYTLQFLDKLSLNYAAAYTLIPDLGLHGQRYSWVAAIFNFGYIAGAIPANYLIQKFPVAKFTGVMIFLWAILLIAHIGATNYAGILVLRFLLGVLESCISPSCMALNVSFYKKSEQPLRMCCFLSFNGIATMLGALLSWGLGHATHSSLKPWKLIFLTIGLINLVWSAIFLLLCPDTPMNARFLNDKEKLVAVKRVSENMMGIKNTKYKRDQIKEAFLDYKTLIYVLIGLACGVINGGSSNFQSALIKGFGFSSTQSTVLQMPTGAIEFSVIFTAGIIAVLVKNTRCIIFCLLCIPSLAGLIGIATIPLEHKWALVGCAWLQYLIGGPVILSWIFLTANVAGSTKKTISNGLWFTFYATGNIIGANIFYAYQKPRYHSGIIGLAISYGGMILIGIIYRLCLMWENNKRDKLYGKPTPESEADAILKGFEDYTDKQNHGFRYSL
jgi:MFS family permease